MSIIIAAMNSIPVTLQNELSATGRGTIIAIPPSLTRHQIIIRTSAGVASGAIQPETADAFDYAGTWAPIGGGPITVPAASSELEYNWEGTYQFLAARISTVIGGGTVTVIYRGSTN